MSVKDKPQTETLAERFRREVSRENLNRVATDLTNAENETGFIAWAIERAEATLWHMSGDFREELEEELELRSDLPTVTLEDVGRLHCFADDVESRIEELHKDVRGFVSARATRTTGATQRTT